MLKRYFCLSFAFCWYLHISPCHRYKRCRISTFYTQINMYVKSARVSVCVFSLLLFVCDFEDRWKKNWSLIGFFLGFFFSVWTVADGRTLVQVKINTAKASKMLQIFSFLCFFLLSSYFWTWRTPKPSVMPNNLLTNSQPICGDSINLPFFV